MGVLFALLIRTHLWSIVMLGLSCSTWRKANCGHLKIQKETFRKQMIKSFSQQSYTQHPYICVYTHCDIEWSMCKYTKLKHGKLEPPGVRLAPCGWPRGHPNAMNSFSHPQCMWGSWAGSWWLGTCETSKSPSSFYPVYPNIAGWLWQLTMSIPKHCKPWADINSWNPLTFSGTRSKDNWLLNPPLRLDSTRKRFNFGANRINLARCGTAWKKRPSNAGMIVGAHEWASPSNRVKPNLKKWEERREETSFRHCNQF